MATTKPVVLHIDTTGPIARVAIRQARKPLAVLTWRSQGASELLVKKIDTMLRKTRLTIGQLTAIAVNDQTGSFTGTRVGVTVANTLGHLLGIPVNGKKPPIAINYGVPYKVRLKQRA
ncbi:hypothetical protein HY065_00710 [Candidatus Berkelbacteria bacterium]|nr:hypothetical protein [Candidatus Berkelbacteria bacterium]